MSEKSNEGGVKETPKETRNNSWDAITERFNGIAQAYSSAMSSDSFYAAFARAGSMVMANNPIIQNFRIKSISTLPADYTKEDIGQFLRSPNSNETALRATSEILRWTAYPYFKISKTYADIPTYRHYSYAAGLTGDEAKTKEFMREACLVDKLAKELRPSSCAHKIAGQALSMGKVVYFPRYEVDKVHGKVKSAFMQQLPEDYCRIIGYNNVSGYTVSFNMMYFLKPGTSVAQYGDLFDPFLDDFNRMFEEPKGKTHGEYVYASSPTVECKGRRINFHPENVNKYAEGNPKVFLQDGRWMYYVSLPIERVFVFEIDDTVPTAVSPLAGMMLTYSQQADYEAAQISLLLSPLVKIFTGEIPYFTDDGASKEDNYKLSVNARMLFESYFNSLMAANNTGGTAFFTAPVENIKSHDYSQSANANDISSSFNKYAGSKAGLAALIPVDDDIKAAQVDASERIENRFVTATIYPQFERMMNVIYDRLNLKFDWRFKMFGTIFDEDKIRENAQKDLDKGDISAFYTLSALDGHSWLDKVSMLKSMDASGIMDMLRIPQTAYTQSGKEASGPEGGRPKKEGLPSESKEKSIDAGESEL